MHETAKCEELEIQIHCILVELSCGFVEIGLPNLIPLIIEFRISLSIDEVCVGCGLCSHDVVLSCVHILLHFFRRRSTKDQVYIDVDEPFVDVFVSFTGLDFIKQLIVTIELSHIVSIIVLQIDEIKWLHIGLAFRSNHNWWCWSALLKRFIILIGDIVLLTNVFKVDLLSKSRSYDYIVHLIKSSVGVLEWLIVEHLLKVNHLLECLSTAKIKIKFLLALSIKVRFETYLVSTFAT